MQWLVLLFVNAYFYLSYGIKSSFFIVATSLIVYFAAIIINKMNDSTHQAIAQIPKEEKDRRKRLRKHGEKINKSFFVVAVVVSLLLLSYFKYCGAIINALNHSLNTNIFFASNLIAPLGISFYTFTSIGYLVDVYWEKVEVEKNYFKFLCFISFFPSIIQGPINRFKEQGKSIIGQHGFDYTVFKMGLLLMLWGFFKKFVIANRAIYVVEEVFGNTAIYHGWEVILGLLVYSIQQYTDFSGGIDIITGIGMLYGIKVAENFRRPYFSSSLSEFWRRWHISLGAWMKDYVFMPFAVSNFAGKIKISLSKKISQENATLVVFGFGNIVVFFLVGIWHGFMWNYIMWGLYNGIVIALSPFFKPVREKLKSLFRLSEKSKTVHVISVIWTFAIVNFGWIFDRSESIEQVVMMIQKILFDFNISSISFSQCLKLGLDQSDWLILIVSTGFLFLISLYQEFGKNVFNSLEKIALPLRWSILYLFIFITIFYAEGLGLGAEAFIYAQF